MHPLPSPRVCPLYKYLKRLSLFNIDNKTVCVVRFVYSDSCGSPASVWQPRPSNWEENGAISWDERNVGVCR